MRILFWSELFWPYIGGAEIVSVKLLPALRVRGYEIIVVTSHDYIELPDEAQYEGIPVYRFPLRTALAKGDLHQLFSIRQRIAQLKRSFTPDLIHLNSVGPSALVHLQTQAVSFAPLLVTLQLQVFLPFGARGHNTLLAQLLRSAHWVTSVSAGALAEARQLTPEITPHSSVIYNFLDTPPLSPAPLPTEEPRILCLGRLIPQKGFDLALTAFATIREQFPRARLLIAGDGTERSALEQQVRRLGITDVVDFLGWIAPDTVPALLNTVSFVLMPSRFEGLPLVAIQAALMARPVIGTHVGGMPEVVIHNKTGVLTSPEDAEGLADAMAMLLTHPETTKGMGQVARDRVQAVFGMEQCVNAYDSLYQSLVPNVQGARLPV